jgi:hypothetical protein
MKRVVLVAVGVAAGMAVGFFLWAMVTRHDEPIVVVHNATDETLRSVCIRPDDTKNLWGVPEVSVYCIDKLQPHQTSTVRLSSRRPTGLNVEAATAGGKEFSGKKIYVESHGVVFALVSFDGITLHYENLTNR